MRVNTTAYDEEELCSYSAIGLGAARANEGNKGSTKGSLVALEFEAERRLETIGVDDSNAAAPLSRLCSYSAKLGSRQVEYATLVRLELATKCLETLLLRPRRERTMICLDDVEEVRALRVIDESPRRVGQGERIGLELGAERRDGEDSADAGVSLDPKTLISTALLT